MYTINDPDIIEKLTQLTGDRELAICLYGDATYICEKLHSNDFHVQLVQGKWATVFDDIAEKMNKTMITDDTIHT
jgi:hypothetical protein